MPFQLSSQDLSSCSGCSKWVQEMSGKSFGSADEAVKTALEIWWQRVRVGGWLEAINAHPRLGDKAAMEAKRLASKSDIQVRTAGEQDALFKEEDTTLEEVTRWNKDYEAKFGHVFLLFAHGKSMADVLEHVKARYNNSPMAELQCAVQQEARIIQHRLTSLLEMKGYAGNQPSDAAAQRTGERPPITCHVLDTSTGAPAVGLHVMLARSEDGSRMCDGVWNHLREVQTNSDGRGVGLSDGLQLKPGVYRVSFDTSAYYAAKGEPTPFYPRPVIDFIVTEATQSQHFHIPLLLSPYSYTTYRGS